MSDTSNDPLVIPVGTPVHYYPNGKYLSAKPSAATVLESYPGGLCTLDVRGSSIKSATKQNVWFHTSEVLNQFKHFVTEYGVWDFHPWFKPPVAVSGNETPDGNPPQTRLEALRAIAGEEVACPAAKTEKVDQNQVPPQWANDPPVVQAVKMSTTKAESKAK